MQYLFKIGPEKLLI